MFWPPKTLPFVNGPFPGCCRFQVKEPHSIIFTTTTPTTIKTKSFLLTPTTTTTHLRARKKERKKMNEERSFASVSCTYCRQSWMDLLFPLSHSVQRFLKRIRSTGTCGPCYKAITITVSKTLIVYWVCCHSSVDLSTPSILLPRVRVPSTPSVFINLYLICVVWKRRKRDQD